MSRHVDSHAQNSKGFVWWAISLFVSHAVSMSEVYRLPLRLNWRLCFDFPFHRKSAQILIPVCGGPVTFGTPPYGNSCIFFGAFQVISTQECVSPSLELQFYGLDAQWCPLLGHEHDYECGYQYDYECGHVSNCRSAHLYDYRWCINMTQSRVHRRFFWFYTVLYDFI